MTMDRFNELKKSVDAAGLDFGACPTESEILAFEVRNGIRLPTNLRRFLLEVGNGGPGPGYGLEPLDLGASIDSLAFEFPLREAWIWDGDPDADDNEIERCFRGSLKLGTEGCGMDWHLIITGSERGRVWNVSGEGAQPCAPARDFIEWYALWLDWQAAQSADEDGLGWWRTVWADLGPDAFG